MLLKFGVDISRLEFHTRRSLHIVEVIYNSEEAPEAVITSTYEGTHSVRSLHYQNRAYDLRLPFESDVRNREIVIHLKASLGKDFDVILEETHIHIEYDPR